MGEAPVLLAGFSLWDAAECRTTASSSQSWTTTLSARTTLSYVPPPPPPPSPYLAHGYIHPNIHAIRVRPQGSFSFSLGEILDTSLVTEGWYVLLDDAQGAKHHFPSRPEEVAAAAAAAAAEDPVAAAKPPAKQGAGKRSVAARSLPFFCSQPLVCSYTVNDFEFVKVLGQGSFGKVFLAREKATNEMYAVKALKKLSVVADNDVAATMVQ